MLIWKMYPSPIYCIPLDLFHRGIPQSGNELGYWAVIKPLMEPEKYILEVAKKLDCDNDNTTDMVKCLRRVKALTLMNTTFECPVGPIFLFFVNSYSRNNTL